MVAMSSIFRWTCFAIVFGVHVVHIAQAQTCPDEQFGSPCLACNCGNPREVCNKVSGACTSGCLGGFMGVNCSQACGPNKFGSGCLGDCHCTNPISCNIFTGACTSGGCEAGYQLNAFNKCIQVSITCPNRQFGSPCRDCNCANIAEVCDKASGSCGVSGCRAGFTGNDCLQACSPNKFGSGCLGFCHCTLQSCNRVTGACTSGGCEAGYQLNDINKCIVSTTCPDRQFGSPCRGCNCVDINEVCDKASGSCGVSGCRVGYTGDDCLQACGPNKFGSGCLDDCHCTVQSCNSMTGACTSGGCEAGYRMDANNKCIACGQNRFGSGCLGFCHCTVQSCNSMTGACTSGGCESGYQLDGNNKCIACGPNKFGSGCLDDCHCTLQSCNRMTGACTSGGCEAGYQKDANNKCIQVSTTCPDRQFGLPCRYCNCADINEVCDKASGSCGVSGCRAGFTGDDCLQACGPNKFGVNCVGDCRCSQPTTCNSVTGACASGGCESGYQLDRFLKCRQACGPNTYGGNCSSECHCALPSACNSVTGGCSSGGCQPGYQLKDGHCQTTCTQGTFDVNCVSNCHCAVQSTCDRVTGICSSDGCQTGWSGFNCQLGLQANQQESCDNIGLTVAVGILVALMVVATVAAIVFFSLWRQAIIRIRKELHSRYAVTKFEHPATGNNPVYEELDGGLRT